MELNEKVALVTGGASWIGLATTRAFLKNGIKGVLIVDIDQVTGAEVEQKLKQEFGENRVTFWKVDIRNPDEFEVGFKKCLDIFRRLDIVINNAGIANEKDYKAIIDINLYGTITGTKLGLKYLSKESNGRGGVIVNVSSVGGFQALETFPVYTGTKSAIITSGSAFGKRYNKTGVKVLTICPSRTTKEKDFQEHISTITQDADIQEFLKLVDAHPNQKPEAIGNSIVYMVQNAESGSVWGCEAAKLYKINIPEWQELRQFVTDVEEN